MNPLPPSFLAVPLAHRGLHDRAAGRIENSRAAVTAALAHGYGIEIDLQLSRDGAAVVFHDDDLGRLTGERGPVRMRDAAELGRIRLRDSAETIPPFAEILDQVAGRVPLLVELKDQHGALGETDGRLETAAAAALRRYAGPVAVMSFNPHMICRMAGLAPDLPRGLVTCGFRRWDWPDVPGDRRAELRRIPDFDRCGAGFISHDATDLRAARVAELKAAGVPVLCWTVRSAVAEAGARAVADNVTFEGYPAAMPG